MRKVNSRNDALFATLFDFGEPLPRNQHLVVIERTTNRYEKITGLQTKQDRCFFQPVDLEDAVSELNAEIKAWQRPRNNWVNAKVHPVKRPKWDDFVLYVQMISPSYTPGTTRVLPSLVPERDYQSLKIFIESLTDDGAYPSLARLNTKP